jgi:hypothetical protein
VTASFKITACFHPSLRTPDGLEATERWFERVFGRASIPVPKGFVAKGFPDDYCIFTLIQEVLFDSLDPVKMPSRLNPGSEAGHPPHLGGVAWYVDDHDALVRACRARGIRLLDGYGNLVSSDKAAFNPLSPTDIQMTFTDFNQVGFPYQFYTVLNPARHEEWGRTQDPRFLKDWRLPEVSDSDPLRLERCAWHTLLTDKPERMQDLLIGLLGGRMIHAASDAARGLESVYVALGDGVYEIARPVADGAAMRDWQAHFRGDEDCYHGVTFKTADLNQARRHLRQQNVRLCVDTGTLIVTDANDSIGVHWGFTSALVPGDPRAA